MSRGRMKGRNDSDDEEYPDMEGWEEADDEDEESDSDDDDEGDVPQRRGKKIAHRSSNQNDIAFEKTLEEYDETDLGYLSEVSFM